MELDGKAAVITGAAGGIGLGMAKAALGRGMRVMIADLDAARADETATQLREHGASISSAGCDVRDFAQVEGKSTIDEEGASSALERLQVDRFGLDEIDRRLLATILEKYDGGPVGLSTLSASIGEDRGTLEEIYEPYLLQIGFLARTRRGRMLTPSGGEHIGLPSAGKSLSDSALFEG